MGVTYPFDWGFIPGTLSDDGDPVDAMCLHTDASFPGVVLPSRCMAVVNVEQSKSKFDMRLSSTTDVASLQWRTRVVIGARRSLEMPLKQAGTDVGF